MSPIVITGNTKRSRLAQFCALPGKLTRHALVKGTYSTGWPGENF